MKARSEAIEAAEELWQLLDNIDTLDDAARSDDAFFRRACRKHLKARFKILSSDGYKLYWEDDPKPKKESEPVSSKKCIGHPVGEMCLCFGEPKEPNCGSA